MQSSHRHSSARVTDEPELTVEARRYSDVPLVCDKCGRTADRSIAGGRDGHSQLCPGCAAERDERRSKSANMLWLSILDEVAVHGGGFGPKIAAFVSAMRGAEADGTDLGHLPAQLVQAAYTAPASPTHIMPRAIGEAEAVFNAIPRDPRMAARANLPLLDPDEVEDEGWHVASTDYPELEDILWTRPDHVEAQPVNVRQVSLAKTATTIKDLMKDPNNKWWFKHVTGPRLLRINENLPPGYKVHDIEQVMGDDNWCRFREDSNCYYPKGLDAQATEVAGYDVWFPVLRGHCPRHLDADQKSCPIAEAGPKSGEPNWKPKLTKSWEQGGQRVAAVQVSVRKRAMSAEADAVPWTIISIKDTRDFMEQGDRWVPITGSGDMRECDRCHRTHEIHAQVRAQTGQEYTVGIGCARIGHPELDAPLKAGVSGATTYARLKAEYDRLLVSKEKIDRVRQEVNQMTVPPKVVTQTTFGNHDAERWSTADDRGGAVYVWPLPADAGQMAERQRCLDDNWRRAMMNDQLTDVRNWSLVDGKLEYAKTKLERSERKMRDMGLQIEAVRKRASATYTLDAEKDGKYFEDHGLTAEQVAAARANADRLGITILNVTEEVDVSVDDLGPFGVTGAWVDVRDKAVRIRRDGGVRILSNTGQTVTAEVHGDHGVYVSSITRVPGTKQRGMWFCGCKWTQYVWARSKPYKRFEGRPCSHSMALLYEIQSHELRGGEMTRRTPIPFGEKVWEQPEEPGWGGGPGTAQEHWSEGLEFESSIDEGSAQLALGNISDSLRVAGAMSGDASVSLAEAIQSLQVVARTSPTFKAKVRGRVVNVKVVDAVPIVDETPVAVEEVLYPTWDPQLGLSLIGTKTAADVVVSSPDADGDGSSSVITFGDEHIETVKELIDGMSLSISNGNAMGVGVLEDILEEAGVSPVDGHDDMSDFMADVTVLADGVFPLSVREGSLIKEAGQRGVMVALSPTRDVCERLSALAAEAGFEAEDPAQIHLTLAYCGKTDEIDRDAFLGAVRAFAAQQRPFQGVIQGLGTFISNEDGAVLWASADIAGLAAARTALTEFLIVAGTPAKMEHDFTPHITLAYADETIMVLPDLTKINGTELKFTTLVAGYGGTWTHFDLVSDSGETVAVEKVASFDDRLGNCYQLAYQYVKRTPGSKLVHGVIGGPNAQASEDGAPPVAHAWAVNADGSVYEPISEETMPVSYFEGLFDGKPVVTYEREEAMIALLKNNHYGPWDLEMERQSAAMHDEFVKWHSPTKESAKKNAKQPTLHLLHDDDEIALQKLREYHGIDKSAKADAEDMAFGRQGLRDVVAKHGFTVNAHYGAAPSSGYMVSAAKSQEKVIALDKLTVEDIADYRDREDSALKASDSYLGAWVNDGKVYLDVSRCIKDREAAMILARENKQLAIYDLSSGNSIDTEELVKAANAYDIDQRTIDTAVSETSVWEERVEREFQEHEGPMSDREHNRLHHTIPNPDASFDPVSYYDMLTDEHRKHHASRPGHCRFCGAPVDDPRKVDICDDCFDYQPGEEYDPTSSEYAFGSHTAQIDEDEGRRAVEEECAKGDYTHSGLIIKALDSGRVLMTQRTPYHNDDDETVGKWEYPGGEIDEGETAIEGALREFVEETGLELPQGWNISGCQPAGNYLAIHVVVPHESWTTDAELLTRETMGIGWFEQEQIEDTTLARPEVQETDWELVAEASFVEAEAEAILHPEPEPALPAAYGTDDEPKPGEYLGGGDDETERLENGGAVYASMNETTVPFMPGPDDPFVPGDPRLAHLAPAPGEAGADNDDIASAAAEFLAKQALKTFSPAEQKQLIDEGADEHLGASNTDRLDVTGTFYEALGEDSDELAFW